MTNIALAISCALRPARSSGRARARRLFPFMRARMTCSHSPKPVCFWPPAAPTVTGHRSCRRQRAGASMRLSHLGPLYGSGDLPTGSVCRGRAASAAASWVAPARRLLPSGRRAQRIRQFAAGSGWRSKCWLAYGLVGVRAVSARKAAAPVTFTGRRGPHARFFLIFPAGRGKCCFRKQSATCASAQSRLPPWKSAQSSADETGSVIADDAAFEGAAIRFFRACRPPSPSTSCASACSGRSPGARRFRHAQGSRRWLVGVSGGKDSYSLLALRWTCSGGSASRRNRRLQSGSGAAEFPKHVLPD